MAETLQSNILPPTNRIGNQDDPMPSGGVGSQSELNAGTRAFRVPMTIPLTQPVLEAVAAGTSDTVTPAANMAAAAALGGAVASLLFGGGAGETLEELPPDAAPVSPYNTVLIESESGHLIEVDDSPESRRVHIYHNSGSHIEMRHDGSVKYKTCKTRQDVTMGNHEIIIKGDCKIAVDGGYQLSIKDGELVINAGAGAAINVKGKLTLNADKIELKATDHIFLNAPKVDIGATAPGGMPMISLPLGVTFNAKYPFDPTLVPIVKTPLSPAMLTSIKQVMANPLASKPIAPTAATQAQLAAVPAKIAAIAAQPVVTPADAEARNKLMFAALGAGFAVAATAALSIHKQVPAAAVVAVLKKALNTGSLDAAGEPASSRLDEQPVAIPLSNPSLYTQGLGAIRARAFDAPDDVDNGESYRAHMNLSMELNDFTDTARVSPGTPRDGFSDTELPKPEPNPYLAFPLISGGHVFALTGETVLVGEDTQFNADLQNGQTIIIDGVTANVQAIINSTALLLTSPWTGPTIENSSDIKSYRLRPMKDFFGTFEYSDSATLGDSGLQLRDLLVNFTSPVFEVPRINAAMLISGTDADIGGTIDESEGEKPCIRQVDPNVPNQFGIIQDLYGDGSRWNLITESGGGEFTNAVVCALGEEWGHIQKSQGQTQHLGHAIDAIAYKSRIPLAHGSIFQFYDIIAGAGAVGAKIQWAGICGDERTDEELGRLWYKPSTCGDSQTAPPAAPTVPEIS